MPRKLGNITTGGQLIGIYSGNFVASIRWPLVVTAVLVVGLVGWQISHELNDQQQYLCLMKLWAQLYNWFEFDHGKMMTVKVAEGRTVPVLASAVPSLTPVVLAWTAMMSAVTGGLVNALIFAVPLNVGWWMVAQKFGADARSEDFQKGAVLASVPDLNRALTAYNQRALAPLYKRLLGANWRLTLALESQAKLDAAGLYRPYEIAGLPYPAFAEQSHTMLVGSTGKGKTVALRNLVSQMRARGDSAVVFDLTGAFVEAFYDPDRDVILNPLDERCPYWSLFDECDSFADFMNTAASLIPHDGGGEEPFWVKAARLLFVTIAMKLAEEGRGTNEALYEELMTADLSHVHELAENTVADPITAPEAARMAESIRSTFNTNAAALRALPSSGEHFSVRDWVASGERKRGSILFLTSRYVDMAVTKILLTLWMDTAVNALLSCPKSPNQLRLWFLFDELGALHRLPSIENGMQTARNYGGAFVLGIHAFAKLKDTYGENIAMTLSSYANTKLILGTADRGTATWASDSIGHQMFREMEEGYSYGQTNVRDAVTLTPRKLIEPLVIPDELLKLPKLRGYLVYPEGMPVALVKLRYLPYEEVAAGFIIRRDSAQAKADGLAEEGQPSAVEGGQADAAKAVNEEARRVTAATAETSSVVEAELADSDVAEETPCADVESDTPEAPASQNVSATPAAVPWTVRRNGEGAADDDEGSTADAENNTGDGSAQDADGGQGPATVFTEIVDPETGEIVERQPAAASAEVVDRTKEQQIAAATRLEGKTAERQKSPGKVQPAGKTRDAAKEAGKSASTPRKKGGETPTRRPPASASRADASRTGSVDEKALFPRGEDSKPVRSRRQSSSQMQAQIDGANAAAASIEAARQDRHQPGQGRRGTPAPDYDMER